MDPAHAVNSALKNENYSTWTFWFFIIMTTVVLYWLWGKIKSVTTCVKPGHIVWFYLVRFGLDCGGAVYHNRSLPSVWRVLLIDSLVLTIVFLTILTIVCIAMIKLAKLQFAIGGQGNAYESPVFDLSDKASRQVDDIPSTRFRYCKIVRSQVGNLPVSVSNAVAYLSGQDLEKPNKYVYSDVIPVDKRPFCQKVPTSSTRGSLWAFFIRHCQAPCSPDPSFVCDVKRFLIRHNVVKGVLRAAAGYNAYRNTDLSMLSWNSYLRSVEPRKRLLYHAAYHRFLIRPYVNPSMKVFAKSGEKQPKDVGCAYEAPSIVTGKR